ncbi:hypothetical protein [Galbitalea soli]|uniref:Uncharacterized protein n=1 Tax=Galbitalea soli TaxID=1268042 RepID=A0A7C9PPT1_9MICO|nr:hypothetical protein [Galbitalea soli]NEM92490.1 hypothetical protein [Galbitalea soli]NYJ29527.1 hypothetical protein [Galbitalea soli]
MIHTKRSRRRRAVMAVAATAAIAVGVVTGPAVAAYAETLSLGPSHVYWSKTFYTKAHYKHVTGHAAISNVRVHETCGAGGYVNIGFRTHIEQYGESTQFPSIRNGSGATFRNVDGPAGYRYTFSSGFYYFNAKLGCEAGTWSGTVHW